MLNYILRRLLLLPLTVFCIILVNFVIINLAPGDPVTVTEVSPDGASRREDQAASGSDERYLQFREHYGLTLPILLNTWPNLDKETVMVRLRMMTSRKTSSDSSNEMEGKQYNALRIQFGDQARYVMPHLLSILEDPTIEPDEQRMAARFFVRGATQQAHLGTGLTPEQRAWNFRVSVDNTFLRTLWIDPDDTQSVIAEKIGKMRAWYEENKARYRYEPTGFQKVGILLIETRFCRYMSKVLTLDFGTLRSDSNKTVTSEVFKRFKYSLTLAFLPMLITFVLCQVFGFTMAVRQNGWQDIGLNVVFLILYAIPVFVVAPFLIEKVALNGTWPFTDTPIPISDFSSSDTEYARMTSMERLFDICQHIALPLVAIMYGGLASQSRLSRTAVLEVLRQDYVRTARAKGLSAWAIMTRHVGRNAAITIVTAIAGSLGIVLGGSLIVETLFDINGFGKFFYEAVVSRDYNVIMFSAIAGSCLTLMGYLIADIAYTLLDPRVTLD
ncbi:hypothetical protein SCG7086_AK_00100 [Chlamydiales bacterium SCGC AG-110-P3]|nr:hypothetical protein SCG7086_AK_00100 [Chlamydiales bacterium SCGC AG-110-P3]